MPAAIWGGHFFNRSRSDRQNIMSVYQESFDWDCLEVLRHECATLANIHTRLMGYKTQQKILGSDLVLDSLRPDAAAGVHKMSATQVIEALTAHTAVLMKSIASAADQSAIRLFRQVGAMKDLVDLFNEAAMAPYLSKEFAKTAQAIEETRAKFAILKSGYAIPFISDPDMDCWENAYLSTMQIADEFSELYDHANKKLPPPHGGTLAERTWQLADGFNDISRAMMFEVQTGTQLAEDCLRMAGTLRLLSWKKGDQTMPRAKRILMDIGHDMIVRGEVMLDECETLRRRIGRMHEFGRPVL